MATLEACFNSIHKCFMHFSAEQSETLRHQTYSAKMSWVRSVSLRTPLVLVDKEKDRDIKIMGLW